MGALVEQVMELYGIWHLLRARSVGPNVLRPALERCAASAQRNMRHIAQLESTLAAPLVSVGHEIAGALHSTLTDVHRSCVGAAGTKLFAKARLAIETTLLRLGGELEQLRELLAALMAASDAVHVGLRCSDLLGERFTTPPIFVNTTVLLRLKLRTQRMLEGDPRILWLMLESGVKRLVDRGVESPMIEVGDHEESCRITLRASEDAELGVDAVALDFGRLFDLERDCVAAISAHLGVMFDESADQISICP